MNIWYRFKELFHKRCMLSSQKKPIEGAGHAAWRFTATRPINGSHTERYALLQAVNPGGYPSDEDYILLTRRPGELFRPAYMVYVPFDEIPPMLLDHAAHPEVAVVYQDFTLVWTDDGGRTIRTPPEVPDGLFPLWRFGPRRIDRVEVQGEHLYVKMAAGGHVSDIGREEADRSTPKETRMWRFRLDGSSDRAELAEPPSCKVEPAGKGDLFVKGGSHLQMRASPQSPWVTIPPEALLKELQETKIDFFGGAAARYVEGPR